MNKLTLALFGLAFVTVIGISVSVFLYSELSTTESTLADTESTLADTKSTLADTKSTLADRELQLKNRESRLEQAQQKLDATESDLETMTLQKENWYRKWDSLANPACTPGGIWTSSWSNTKSVYFSLSDNTMVWYLDGQSTRSDSRERVFDWSRSGNTVTAASVKESSLAQGALTNPMVWTLEFSSDCNTLSGPWSQTDGGSGRLTLKRN